ncbi:MAG: hypothetical protein WC879_08850 [Melioribacteraceae bacterium]
MHGKCSEQNIIQVKLLFTNLFGNTSKAKLNVCPASLILLGDHTHYNEGVLISVCIDKYWIFLMRRRRDSEINIASTDSNKLLKMNLDRLDEHENSEYKLLRGLIRILKQDGILKNGFDCVVSSSVPECLGLGSLAAEQVGFLNAMKKTFSLNINNDELLSYVRKNELNLVGKISNIAHHYTIQFGREKKLFYMDLRTKEHKILAIDRDDYSLIICDSGEEIIEPQKICNERIEECEVGVKGLRLYIWGIKNLRDVNMDFLHKHYHVLPHRIFNRILYNVKERIRAEEAAKLIRKKSFRELGNLVMESYKNLAEEYELKNEHCDFLVNEAVKLEKVLCSKMISCSPIHSTFNIVADDKINLFNQTMEKLFEQKFNKHLKTYVIKLAGGVKKIPLHEYEPSPQ